MWPSTVHLLVLTISAASTKDQRPTLMWRETILNIRPFSSVFPGHRLSKLWQRGEYEITPFLIFSGAKVYFHLPISAMLCFNTGVFVATVVSLCRGYKSNRSVLSSKRVMPVDYYTYYQWLEKLVDFLSHYASLFKALYVSCNYQMISISKSVCAW